jgi:hypothetical protein
MKVFSIEINKNPTGKSRCGSTARGTDKKTLRRYRGADKSLARPRRKQAAAKEDFELHISYLKS